MSTFFRRALLSFALLPLATALQAAEPRARDLGVPFEGTPGPLNAITDVAGVEVGHSTIISAEGVTPAVRTGVTAVLPRGKRPPTEAVFAGWFSQNGNGEMTGTTWLAESGLLYGPVMITNTHSVGVVRDAVIAWGGKHYIRHRRLVVAARCRGDLGWLAERHQRFPREARACLRGAGHLA